MEDTSDVKATNELVQKLEGLEEEQKVDIIAEFIKQHEKNNHEGVFWNGELLPAVYDNDIVYKYTNFLKEYKYKIKLAEIFSIDVKERLIKEFRESSIEEKIKVISKELNLIDGNEKLELIEDFIKKYEKEEAIRAYYDRGATTSYTKYTNVDKYVKLLDNYDDKLKLAQNMCDFDVAEKLLEEYPFTDEERKKYCKLAENNEDIATVLNPKLLSKKYDFLGDKLDFVINDNAATIYISNLSDKELDLFKLLYNKAEIGSAEILHTLLYMPLNLNKYSELTSNICNNLQENEIISDEIIEKLLWVYTMDYEEHFSIKSDIINKLSNLQDITNLEDIIKTTCDSIIDDESKKSEKDISKIKEALIMSTYGIGLDKAEALLKSYDISKFELTEENKHTMLMYLAISEICNETNPDKLITIYNEYTQENPIKINYLRDVVFQNELRIMFAKELNNTYANRQDFERINEQDSIPIYDAGTDFKICMTSIGAYQENFKEQKNYFNYWNNKKILSHINCCSLIANNNLSTATIRNICLGFSNFDNEMLICGSNRDINSTDMSERMYGMKYSESKLKSPEELINSTRGQYNEIDYERRDLGDGQYYKKNPDFIVFFEEFDDIDNMDIDNLEIQQILNDEKRKWQESVKAAKEFGIPIVKINREKCAKSESKKIEKSFKKYMETHDIGLLSDIITNFENNRTGTREHNYLTQKYFSNEKIQNMLDKIFKSVKDLQDKKLKISNTKELIKILKKEEQNTKECNIINNSSGINALLGFDVDKYLNIISTPIKMEKEENER